jgi:hypothetical protein
MTTTRIFLRTAEFLAVILLSTLAWSEQCQITAPLPLPVTITGGGGGGTTGPTVSMTANPAGAVEELGSTITYSTFTAVTVNGTNPITTFFIKKNGITVFTDPTPNPNGGTEVFVDSNIIATASYIATVGDGSLTGNSNTITYTFVYPFYYGVGAQALSFASVQGLTKLIQVKQNTTTTTSPTNQVYYFAYPQAYGSLISILDQNGFETIGGYTQRSGTMTLLDGSTQNYYVYEFNSLTTQVNFRNTYKFF